MSSKQDKTETDSSKSSRSSNSTGNRRNQDKRQTDDTTPRGAPGKRNPTGSSRHHGNPNSHEASKAKGGGWDTPHKGRHRPPKDGEHYRKPRDSHTIRNTNSNSQSSKLHRNNKGSGSVKPHPPQSSDEALKNFDSHEKKDVVEDSNSLLADDITKEDDVNEVGIGEEEEEKEEELEGEREGVITDRYIYDRDELLLLKESTFSLLSPLSRFDTIETEIIKEILKRHNSSSSSNNDYYENENDTLDELKPKHPATLSLIREHDPKSTAKVSLSPQRRSFGSGCSWRESPVKNGPHPPAPPSQSSTNELEKDDVFYHRVTTPTNHKVIDHVPYRSRGNSGKGEWQEPSRRRGNSWRETGGVDGTGNAPRTEDEPEWMSYGPDDCTEIMELKGFEDHELERGANKTTGNNSTSSLEDKRTEGGVVTPDPSPSSSVGENFKDDYDSGLPSSSPHDDDHEFMLDGFDFSTGVSICQALSDEDEELPTNSNNSKNTSLPPLADKHQLTNVLMNVLKIPPTNGGGGVEAASRPLRAMTLDEIEEPRPQEVDHDQTAFNKLLAVINSPLGGGGSEGQGKGERREQYLPVGGSNNSHVNRTLFTEETDQLHPLHVRGAGGRYTGPQEQWNTPTSVPSQWGGAGGVAYRPHFFKPTPASLGMQPHVRHAHVLSQQGSPQQQQQQGVNSSWISEMEIRRRSELNQMMIAEKERQRQLVQRSNNSSSISFLPTSVIRQMHTKPHPPVQPHQTSMEHPSLHNSHYEREYQSMRIGHQPGGGVISPHPQTFHHPSLLPPHIRQHHLGGGASSGRSVGGQVDPVGGPNVSYSQHVHYRMTYQQQ